MIFFREKLSSVLKLWDQHDVSIRDAHAWFNKIRLAIDAEKRARVNLVSIVLFRTLER